MRRSARIIQIIHDFAPKPLSECRVLDLAALEGGFGAECAIRGAEVLAIEGRKANIERGMQRHSYPNLRFLQDDIRNLDREKHGEFDIVLCLGVLYHLDVPDCFQLLEKIFDVCTGFAIIDTQASMRRTVTVQHRGKEYSGTYFGEHSEEATKEEMEAKVWSAIGNRQSFWPTKPSLVNAIVDAGFTSVYESQFPAQNDIVADRVAMVALKGERQRLRTIEFDEAILTERVDEIPKVPPVIPAEPPTDDHPGLLRRLIRRLKRRVRGLTSGKPA